MKNKWFVGFMKGEYRFKAFTSNITPTKKTHGKYWVYVIGPFKTKRGAIWAETYGWANPHFLNVSDAERIAKNQ